MPFTLVGLGELLWDHLPDGRRAGGAPANFAVHAAQLGAAAWVVSRVGDDEPGRALVNELAVRGVNTAAVEVDPAAPTGHVSVTVSAGQPTYTIHEGVAWDRIATEPAARTVMAEADAVCFGSLAQRAEPSRSSIQELLKLVRPGCLRIFDVNLRQQYHSREVLEESFAQADMVKVNDAELVHLAGLFLLPGGERERLEALAGRYGLKAVACTRGERGSVILAGGTWSEVAGVPVAVADTVGAGDSFTAALAVGQLAGWPLDVAHERAAAVAAFVCTQSSGMPELPPEVAGVFR